MISTAAAALLRPALGRGALGLWAGGVLIDADHYLWFARRQRRLSPVAAVRFFNAAGAPRSSATRLLHHPLGLAALLAAGARSRRVRSLAAGAALHVALDAFHGARMRRVRRDALERDGYACRACETRGAQVGTHVSAQPLLLPSYDSRHVISLCDRCHDRAHASGRTSR